MNDIIKKKVFKCINLYNTNNPFEIADYLKIEVQKGDLGELCGCYMYLKKHKCIFLNNNLNYEDAKIVMAHELGHAVLHAKTNCYFMKNKTLFTTSRIERQANIFAAELLINECTLRGYEGLNIEQISCITGINLELVKLKLGVEI